MTEERTRWAVAIAIPLILFCAVYVSLQTRRIRQDTAALRVEVQALHTAVGRLEQRPAAARPLQLPSPRPTAAKAKARTAPDDGQGPARSAKGLKAKAKAREDGDAPARRGKRTQAQP